MVALLNSTISLRHKPVGSEGASIRQGIRCDIGRTLSWFLPLAEWLVLQNYVPSGVLHLGLLLELEDTETDYEGDDTAHDLMPGGRPTPMPVLV